MLSDDALRAAIVAFFEKPLVRVLARMSDDTPGKTILFGALARAMAADPLYAVGARLSWGSEGGWHVVPWALHIHTPLGIEARIVNDVWQVTLTNSSTPATDLAVTKTEPAYVWVVSWDNGDYTLFSPTLSADTVAAHTKSRSAVRDIDWIEDPGIRNSGSVIPDALAWLSGKVGGAAHVEQRRVIAAAIRKAQTTPGYGHGTPRAEPDPVWASLFANGDIRIHKEKPTSTIQTQIFGKSVARQVVVIPDVGAPPGMYLVLHSRNAELRALVDKALARSSEHKIETNKPTLDASQNEEQVMMIEAWMQKWARGDGREYTVSKTKAQADRLCRAEAANTVPLGQPHKIEVGADFDMWDAFVAGHESSRRPDMKGLALLYQEAWPRTGGNAEGDPPSRKERLKTQGKQLGAILLEGSAMAAVDQSGEAILKAADKWAQAAPNDRAWLHDLLKTPRGRDLVKLTVALVVHTLAHQTDFVPKPEIVSKVAELQLKASSFKFVGENLGVLFELLGEFVTIGQTLPKGMLAEDSEDTADIFSHLGEKVRASS